MIHSRMLMVWLLLRELNPAYLESWRVLNLKITAIWWERVIVLAMIGFFYTGMNIIASPDPLPFVFLTGLILSYLFAAGVSWAINTTKERACYDLICMSERGPVGTDWTIAALFMRASFAVIPIKVIISVVPGILLLYGIGKMMDGLSDPIIGANLVSLSILLPLDCMYSVVIGTLTGILSASNTSRRSEAIWLAGAWVLTVQLLSYIAFWIVNATIFASFIEWVILTVIALAGYVVVREMTVRALWLRLNMTVEELLEFKKQVAG
jgi:hypothetical protein